MYGPLDESGAPGVKCKNNDYLVVSLIVFDAMDDKDAAETKIADLRKHLKLPEDYEFHCHNNSTKPQQEFINLLSRLNFRFITIAIRKDFSKKTASYKRISELLVPEIQKYFPSIKIEMDSNPILFAELKRSLKINKLTGAKIRQVDSRKSSIVQMADYVVSISSKKVKNTPKATEFYPKIAKKMLAFIEVAK